MFDAYLGIGTWMLEFLADVIRPFPTRNVFQTWYNRFVSEHPTLFAEDTSSIKQEGESAGGEENDEVMSPAHDFQLGGNNVKDSHISTLEDDILDHFDTIGKFSDEYITFTNLSQKYKKNIETTTYQVNGLRESLPEMILKACEDIMNIKNIATLCSNYKTSTDALVCLLRIQNIDNPPFYANPLNDAFIRELSACTYLGSVVGVHENIMKNLDESDRINLFQNVLFITRKNTIQFPKRDEEAVAAAEIERLHKEYNEKMQQEKILREKEAQAGELDRNIDIMKDTLVKLEGTATEDLQTIKDNVLKENEEQKNQSQTLVNRWLTDTRIKDTPISSERGNYCTKNYSNFEITNALCRALAIKGYTHHSNLLTTSAETLSKFKNMRISHILGMDSSKQMTLLKNMNSVDQWKSRSKIRSRRSELMEDVDEY